MKKLYASIILLILSSGLLNSQIVINEFQSDIDQVEIKNIGDSDVDVSAYILCSFPVYNDLNEITLISGDLMLSPGEIVVVSGHSMGDDDDELGLYLTPNFTDPTQMIDYVEWGSTGHTRSSVAVAAGIWQTGDFVASPMAGMSYMWDGGGDAPANWFVGDATWGEENLPPTRVVEFDDLYMTLYPNPGTEVLNLVLNNNETSQIIVFDRDGRIIKRFNTQNQTVEINTSEWAAGIYTVVADQGGRTAVSNWIKQ